MTNLEDAAREFVQIFEQLGVPYAIMGGLAVRVYALPRPTFDVDFSAAITQDRLHELYDAAAGLGYTIPASQKAGWIDRVRGMPVVKFQWFVDERAIDIDVFVAETPFQMELLSRRQRHDAGGWNAWFVSPEDLLLLKLLADRAKDRADVADLLLVQGALDEAYLRNWATALGVAAALEEALGEKP